MDLDQLFCPHSGRVIERIDGTIKAILLTNSKPEGHMSKSKKGLTRRTFLKGLPIGLLGALAIGIVGSTLLRSTARKRPPLFREGSIFTPRDEQS